MKIIGIYCGSFDPIHTGHAIIANILSQSGLVDELWLVVSKVSPFKTDSPPAADFHRLEMARFVAADCSNVKVSDIELGMPDPSYTIDTLSKLKESYPEYRFRLIIGGDNWKDFSKWKDADRIISEYGVIIYPRPNSDIPDNLPSGVTVVHDKPFLQISSSLIREMIKRNENVNFLLPVKVAEYIGKNKLYKN